VPLLENLCLPLGVRLGLPLPPLLRMFLRRRFKAFISKELFKVVKKQETVDKLTAPEPMKLWAAAFTHASITGIPGQNYEGLETKGDAFLALAFFSYVDTILPVDERTPSYYTELRRYWLSKTELAKFSIKLGLPKFIKFAPGIMERADANLREDVFESFFGAFFTIFDKYTGIGNGYLYGYSYFTKFIKDVDILLPEEQIFPAKTKLKEMFDSMKWGDVLYVSKGDPNATPITVEVRDYEGDELARGTGIDRTAAENMAAANAVKALAAQNPPITRETIASAKPVDKQIEGLKSRIDKFLSTKGKYGPLELVRIYKKPGKNGIQLVELRTTQDFGTDRALKVALGTGRGMDARSSRIDALQQYINLHNIA
jgi:dsRNA-specific ribonuclease